MSDEYKQYLQEISKTRPLLEKKSYMMYCCADSSLTYAPYGNGKAKPIGAAMPVLSVESKQEAEAIIGMVGRVPYGFDDDYEAKHPDAGPEKRIHYSLPDFQFNNERTLVNVSLTLAAVRDAMNSNSDAMHQAFEDARQRAGRFFTDAKFPSERGA